MHRYRATTMDDILIIVLTLLFTALAAINQSKKKKHAEASPGPDPWKELLGIPGQPDAIPFPVPEIRHDPHPSVPVPHGLPIQTLTPADEEEGMRNEFADALRETRKENGETRDAEEEEGFSLRKAVIYSEIYNPKYF